MKQRHKGHEAREGEDRHMANVALNQLPNKKGKVQRNGTTCYRTKLL